MEPINRSNIGNLRRVVKPIRAKGAEPMMPREVELVETPIGSAFGYLFRIYRGFDISALSFPSLIFTNHLRIVFCSAVVDHAPPRLLVEPGCGTEGHPEFSVPAGLASGAI